VACFGPVGLKIGSPEYGCILTTSPKAAWRGVNVLRPLVEACRGGGGAEEGQQPPPAVLFDTDVNAPALSEYAQASSSAANGGGITSAAYITVGTGVGVGLVVNGRTVHGRMHPEGGQLSFVRSVARRL
jgi:fructokinase